MTEIWNCGRDRRVLYLLILLLITSYEYAQGINFTLDKELESIPIGSINLGEGIPIALGKT